MLPISHELADSLQNLTPLQLAWLSGYCWGRADGSVPAADGIVPAAAAAVAAVNR